MYYLEFACPPKVEAIKLFLSAGNDIKLSTSDGNNAIHYLARNP